MGEVIQHTPETTIEWHDTQLARLIDRYDPERIAEDSALREQAMQNSGVCQERIKLWKLGVVIFDSNETQLLQTSLGTTVLL